MKKHILGMVVFAMALLAVPSTIAQGSGGDVLVDVPFAFSAGSHRLPPGRYTVTRHASGLIRIYGAYRSNQSVFLGVNRVESREDKGPRLIFHRYGDSYFLAQVWSTGWGRELPKSKAEKEFLSQSRTGARSAGEVAVVRGDH